MSALPVFARGAPFPIGMERSWRMFDPFLLCDHFSASMPPAYKDTLGPDPALLQGRNIGSDFSRKDGWSMAHGETVPGFPKHPHRGFETISILRQGYVDHSDSLGATARLGPGDVQWMTAGSGIQHCEMMPLLNRDGPNPAEGFQLWLNLPAASKGVPAHFKMFWDEEIPVFKSPSGARIRVIASGRTALGGVGGNAIVSGGPAALPPPPASWAARADSDVAVWVIDIPAGGSVDLPPSSAALAGRKINRVVYAYTPTGAAVVSQTGAAADAATARLTLRSSGVQVDAAAALTLSAADGNETKLLVLQGAPIGEPVAQYGPFVMNTQQEIMQAFSDFRRTNFGEWKWGRADPVHPRDAGRFAVQPDGSVMRPPASPAA
jgi:redox-sensitive bicupin YhaK (pirin superfamily)